MAGNGNCQGCHGVCTTPGADGLVCLPEESGDQPKKESRFTPEEQELFRQATQHIGAAADHAEALLAEITAMTNGYSPTNALNQQLAKWAYYGIPEGVLISKSDPIGSLIEAARESLRREKG